MAEVVHMIDSEVFLAYSTYATIVILKMMLLSLLTTSCQLRRKVSVDHEDTVFVKSEDDQRKAVRAGPDVERVRRWHQNDLENIVSFVLIGLLYALTGPDLHVALLHFRVFLCSQIVHTVAYMTSLPPPTRTLAFSVGIVCTLSMVYRVLCTAFYL
ncbi:microsomal glutathione S-transferase 1-like [Anguilla anguilla]|uniref:microsomal glutathione S-transferase 1-like n=1 Tax=Anguilla anguilla TaxID=7936 RepID=UPI0015B151DB|nr:microsomal glutathione S-transferase 1-like [Anguilla anguilla]XP_035281860.1 microsomal glutathione S-transferase 1-like [Anguilla anguilla]XP_035281861.1 microsomal glutathione S-transferase 1-like [Anguilla anguilla]